MIGKNWCDDYSRAFPKYLVSQSTRELLTTRVQSYLADKRQRLADAEEERQRLADEEEEAQRIAAEEEAQRIAAEKKKAKQRKNRQKANKAASREQVKVSEE